MSTQARSDAIQAAARALVEAHGGYLETNIPLKAMALALMAQTGCHRNTARQHLAKAVRVLRGEASAANGRGGAGRGQGRKASPPEPPKEIVSARVLAGGPVYVTRADSTGVEILGRGRVTGIDKTGTDRRIIVTMDDDSRLHLLVFGN